jgi:cell division protein FtsL
MAIRAALHSPSLKTWVLPIFLMLFIVGSAMAVVQQVFLYRQEFRDLQEVRAAREDLDVEWGRLLIEQQTFGATAQIGSRAVMTLRMYSPPPSQTVVLTTPTL